MATYHLNRRRTQSRNANRAKPETIARRRMHVPSERLMGGPLRAPIELGDLTVYLYENCPCGHEDCKRHPELAEACTLGKVRYGAVAFIGEQGKPLWHHMWKTDRERDKYILDTIKSRKAVAKVKAERKSARSAGPDRPVQVGDIFSTSWGYEQTNVEFFMVVAVRGKSTVDVQEIAQTVVESGRGGYRVVADPTRVIGKLIKGRRVTRGYRGEASFKVEDHYATPWDGAPKHTSGGYGH